MYDQKIHLLRLSLFSLFFLALVAMPTVPVLADGDGGIVFTDIAPNPDSGIEYRRVRSERDAIFQEIKEREQFDFDDLLESPLKSRGAPGVALFDYDGDGDLDIYATNGPGAANSLYSNQFVESGEVWFVDVAESAGVAATDQDSSGVCYGDVDNDGDRDLYVLGSSEPNRFFEHQGDGTFVDVTEASGLGGGDLGSTSCSFGDVDGDGLLDVLVANTFDMSAQFAIFVEPFALNEHNQLFMNQGDNVFVDRAEEAGLYQLDLGPNAEPLSPTITWTAVLVDIDLDGDQDIVQADDQAGLPPDVFEGLERGFVQILTNDGAGNFTVESAARGLIGFPQLGTYMGLSFADYDNNGTLDFFVTNFGRGLDSRWYLQNEDGTFADPLAEDVRFIPFGWGTSSFDYDNDGDTDIFFHGGLDVGQEVELAPAAVLRNAGDAQFSRDFEAFADSTDHLRRTVHGMAVGDLNLDGFTDVVSVSNFDMPDAEITLRGDAASEWDEAFASVLTFLPIFDRGLPATWAGLEFPDGTLAVELSSADNEYSWARIEVLGTYGLTSGGSVNRDGIGAILQFKPGVRLPTVMQPVLGGASYASQDSLVTTFGMAQTKRGILDVLWPGGVKNRVYGVKPGDHVLVPEVPCSYDTEADVVPYLVCVIEALDELRAEKVISQRRGNIMLWHAIRAYYDAR